MMSLCPEDIALLHEAIKGRQKIPRAYTKALQQMNEADTNTTGRIFLEHGGVSAWTAYILTKRAAECKGHVSGRGKRQRLLARLEELPVKARQASAVQLATAMEPDKERIEQVMQKACESVSRISRRRRQRHATTSVNDAEEAGASEDGTSSDDLLECHNTPSRPPSPLSNSNKPVSEASHHDISQPPHDDTLHPFHHGEPQSLCSLSTEKNDEHIFVNASITACNRLFPEYLARAIKRDPMSNGTLVAAVSMTFPRDHNKKAFLSIEVMPNKIERIAWELFGVHLENEAGFRYACVGAARVVPTPSFGFQCCRVGPIALMFGADLAGAICANPAYQQERLREDDYTNCVGMVVPAIVDECAQICISLHVKEGAKLRDILFPCA